MESSVTSQKEAQLDVLLEKVYRDSGHDFRDYKRSTVVRRLERRLLVSGISTYLDYVRFLETHPEEYDRFAEYLNIKVSGFFRHPYAYEQLAGLVLPELVASKRRRGDLKLRFWSTACARGEEPYSLAIMLGEFLGSRHSNFDIAIYATDVSRETLREVRVGRYSPSDLEGIPGRILTHQQLLEKVWGWEYTDDLDYVRIYVSHLRRKIEPEPALPKYIVTEPGVGYCFQKPE